jgi:hypothetical protein
MGCELASSPTTYSQSKGQVADFWMTVLFLAIATIIILLAIGIVTLAAGRQIQNSFSFRQETAQGAGIIQGLLALQRSDRSFGEVAIQAAATGLQGTGIGLASLDALSREIASDFGIDKYSLFFSGKAIESAGVFCGDSRASPQLLAWCETSCAPGRIAALERIGRCGQGTFCCAEAYDRQQRRYDGSLFYTVGDLPLRVAEISCSKAERGGLTFGVCELGGCSPGRDELTGANTAGCSALLGTLPSREPALTQRLACCIPQEAYEPETRPPALANLPVLWDNLKGTLDINIEVMP